MFHIVDTLIKASCKIEMQLTVDQPDVGHKKLAFLGQGIKLLLSISQKIVLQRQSWNVMLFFNGGWAVLQTLDWLIKIDH